MIGYRRLGRTGLDVSRYTIGSAPLAAPGLDRNEAASMLACAIDHGINALEIDAASEPAIEVVRDGIAPAPAARRPHILSRVPSRIPFDLPSPHVSVHLAYPGWHIRSETEKTLRSLGVERLGLQMLHAWCPEWEHEGDWLETLKMLRDEGKIAGFGVSLFDHDWEAGKCIVTSGTLDAIQLLHNVFDPAAGAMLLPLCQRHDIAVIARTPLYFGALVTPPSRPTDVRKTYFYDEHRRETGQRAEAIARDMAPFGCSLREAALRFSLSPEAVSTVAIGTHSRAQLESNRRAIDAGPLPAEPLAALAKHAWLC